jgi:hypothetical protein
MNILSFPCFCVGTDHLDAPASSAGRMTVPEWVTTQEHRNQEKLALLAMV